MCLQRPNQWIKRFWRMIRVKLGTTKQERSDPQLRKRTERRLGEHM